MMKTDVGSVKGVEAVESLPLSPEMWMRQSISHGSRKARLRPPRSINDGANNQVSETDLELKMANASLENLVDQVLDLCRIEDERGGLTDTKELVRLLEQLKEHLYAEVSSTKKLVDHRPAAAQAVASVKRVLSKVQSTLIEAKDTRW
jgi:hypothetical protein